MAQQVAFTRINGSTIKRQTAPAEHGKKAGEMRNITSEMRNYREAVKNLWNSSFSFLNESFRYGASLDLFEQIDELLFQALVCVPHGITVGPRASNAPIPSISISPIAASSCAVMINRASPAIGYWDDSRKLLCFPDVGLALIGIFDWDGYNYKECQYYRVRIVSCQSDKDLEGRDAILETDLVNVFWIGNT